MNQDIRQWLAEMKALQHKLAEVQQERDQAYLSAANWRHLYETEAKQRRADLETAQARIAELETTLSSHQRLSPDASNYDATLRQQVEQWQTAEDLRIQLVQAWMERDGLTQVLNIEQQAHAQTRQNLTMALSDALHQLAKVRRQPVPLPPAGVAKAPSPEPRMPDPVQFRS
jgi:hypothetical protein